MRLDRYGEPLDDQPDEPTTPAHDPETWTLMTDPDIFPDLDPMNGAAARRPQGSDSRKGRS